MNTADFLTLSLRIFFWIATIYGVCSCVFHEPEHSRYDDMSGYEIWNENMKNYEANK